MLVAYPIATLFCIIVTANHYWLDGIGGLVTLGAGYLVARGIERWSRQREMSRSGQVAGLRTT
jgi:hypothetical protein